jgi:hypothetical protein
MSRKAVFMLLFSIVGGSFGQNCGPNDFYDPACLNTDWCSDIHEELNQLSPCHYDKLKTKNQITNNKCCDDSIFSNGISHMFTDRCTERDNNGQDVCRKPEAGSTMKLAKKFNNCPEDCTTKVKLYKNEYKFQGDELKLESTFKDKDAVYVHPQSSCQAYTCGYENRETSIESWKIRAKTCLCLKDSKRTELNNTIGAKWTRCKKNSLNQNPLTCSEPKQFDVTEFEISGDKIVVDYPRLEIHKDDNYCFGPSWTENEDALVKMKLFYCKKGTETKYLCNESMNIAWFIWSSKLTKAMILLTLAY